MRYFRSSSVDAYEAVRAAMDVAYGYPNPSTKTVTAIPPATESPHDTAGRVYLAGSDAECQYPSVVHLLAQAISNGAVEEITQAEYQEAVQQQMP